MYRAFFPLSKTSLQEVLRIPPAPRVSLVGACSYAAHLHGLVAPLGPILFNFSQP
jgi:hypothetical protein